MYKDIVVPVTATPGDGDAIDFAVDFAAHFDAHLTVLELVQLPTPPITPWSGTPDLVVGDLYGRRRAQGVLNVARLKARLAQAPADSEVRLVESLLLGAERAAAYCARHADLAVVAGPLGDTAEGEPAHRHFGELLLESGRPVLMVPPGCRTRLPLQRVLLAWRPRREATRALHDALPLLRQAERVDVLVVDPDTGERGDGEQPGAEIAAHLARHGVAVEVVVRRSQGRAVSAVLLEHAREMPAQLIVAGGYGHSRVREWMMGGVTRELLISAPLPVLFSH